MGAPGDPESVALLDEALAAVGDEHSVLRARLLGRLAGTPPRADVMATRRRLADEAYALATASGDLTALRDALSARLWAALGPDHLATRLEVAEELRVLGERAGNLPMVLLAHDAELGAQLLLGAMPAATRALAAYARTADALKQPAFLFNATFWEGSLALAEGRLADAEGRFRTAYARGRGTVPFAHFMYAGQMYPLVYLRGGPDDPELDRIFFGEMIDLPYTFEPAVRGALAFALWLRGDASAARAEFERVLAQLPSLARDEHWLMTVGGLGRIAVLLGDTGRAADLHALLLPYADLVLVHDMLRAVGEPVASVLAHLETLLGRFDAAAEHYQAAVARTAAMGARLPALDCKAGQWRLCEVRGAHGDRARAAVLRDELAAEMAFLGVRRNWLLDATAAHA
jgi:tetratricopeptide (TPR) repeat protein